MRALVTGGAGFIGSHLCERLLADGATVSVIDDLSTGRIENIEHLKGNANFKFTEGSVRDGKVLEPLIEKSDVVFHLAAAVGVQLIVDRPVHTIETNIHGTEMVLEFANKYSKKVLITSTSEVYGKSDNIPFHEDDDMVLGSTMFSRWSYACSKAIDEFLAFAYHDQYGLEVVVSRLFNTIGPRQVGHYGMVVPRFVERALKGEPIQIYGDGKQSRCFAYVGDVVEAIVGLAESNEAAGKVFNVGSNEEISIEGLADLIIKKTDSKSEKEFISYKEAYGKAFDDMQRRVPCLERIKAATGYEPKTSLEQTLEIIIDHFRGKDR
jgi:nucleoside-diphosphate-sugar epimerase